MTEFKVGDKVIVKPGVWGGGRTQWHNWLSTITETGVWNGNGYRVRNSNSGAVGIVFPSEIELYEAKTYEQGYLDGLRDGKEQLKQRFWELLN